MADKDLNKILQGFKSNDGEFQLTNTLDAVANSFEDLIRKLQENVKKSNHGDDQKESQLGASIVALPKILGSKVIIEVRFEDYGLEVDKGRRAEGYSKDKLKKLQPQILNWISRRPRLQRVAMEMQRKKSIKDLNMAKKSLSYAIATNILKKGTIKRFGYKGSNWFSKEIKNGGGNWEKQLKEKIARALGQDVRIEFKIIADEFNK